MSELLERFLEQLALEEVRLEFPPTTRGSTLVALEVAISKAIYDPRLGELTFLFGPLAIGDIRSSYKVVYIEDEKMWNFIHSQFTGSTNVMSSFPVTLTFLTNNVVEKDQEVEDLLTTFTL